MATLKIQPVHGDLGSQEVAQLVHSYNHLLDTLSTLILGMSTAANTAGINALCVTADASLEAVVCKIQQQPQIPMARRMATV